MNNRKFQRILFFFFYFFSGWLFADSGYILCIDGGGSKTILQVLDTRGQLISLVKNNAQIDQVEASCSNINTVGEEGVRAVFQALFEEVQLGHDLTKLADILPYCRVVAGMAGAIIPQNKQTITALFEEYGICRNRILLMSDAELALKLIDERGIILISGTGSICLAKKDNIIYRVGGLGRILGDEGSGYHMGIQALKAALAEEYGWGNPTSLTPLLKELFGVIELKTLISKINLGEIKPSKLASLAPIVFKEAFQGDGSAQEIVSCASKNLAELLITQLNISNLSNCEVHLWGGIFKNSYVDAFIQEIIEGVDSNNEKNLKFINRSFENPAIAYVLKFR